MSYNKPIANNQDFVMEGLVRYENKELVKDTQIIAKELGLKHARIMLHVDKFLDDYPDLRQGKSFANLSLRVAGSPPLNEEKIVIESRSYRNRGYRIAIMNRQAFSLLMMRFESPKARIMQRKFNSAFYEMERYIQKAEFNSTDPTWISARNQGKLVRHEQTDVIQKFVNYATEQGSENAKYYYKHITNSTYKALGLIQHKQPKLRDTLSGLEIAWLMSAEHVAKQSLLRHMEEKEHYKTIFVLAKQDIERFAEGLMLPVLSGK